MKKPIYADLNSLTEEERVALIVEAATAGKKVGFVVEDDGQKGSRYISKILKISPQLSIRRAKGPIKNTESIFVELQNRAKN